MLTLFLCFFLLSSQASSCPDGTGDPSSKLQRKKTPKKRQQLTDPGRQDPIKQLGSYFG